MKVLQITPTYRPSVGGIEAVVEGLSRHLVSRGIVSDVAQIAPGLTFGSDQEGGTRIWRLPLVGHAFAGIAPALKDIAANYDLLHVHDPQLLAISANVIAYAGKKPAVLSTHGGFHHTRKYRSLKSLHEKLLLARVLRHYRRILATSAADAAYFSRFAGHVVLAENGVDVVRFQSIAAAKDRSPWQWIYWGRLSRNKRLDLAVATVRRARNGGYPVQLTICGNDFDGSGEELKRLVEPQLAPHIAIRAAADDAELAKLIARSGVYITPSEHEGFGLTVIEAMAAGLIVICRNIAPLNGFVTHDCGLPLEFDGSRADDEALRLFLAALEGSHCTSSTNAKHAAGRFDWEHAVGRFAAEYQAALPDLDS